MLSLSLKKHVTRPFRKDQLFYARPGLAMNWGLLHLSVLPCYHSLLRQLHTADREFMMLVQQSIQIHQLPLASFT